MSKPVQKVNKQTYEQKQHKKFQNDVFEAKVEKFENDICTINAPGEGKMKNVVAYHKGAFVSLIPTIVDDELIISVQLTCKGHRYTDKIQYPLEIKLQNKCEWVKKDIPQKQEKEEQQKEEKEEC